MKILFLTAWYPTATNSYSGVFVKEHAKAVRYAGDDVTVLAIVVHRSRRLWHKRVEDKYDEFNIRTIKVEVDTCFRDMFYHAVHLQYAIAKKIYRNLISEHFVPEIIHSSVIFPAGIVGHWLSKRYKVPHVITEHWSRVSHFMKIPVLSYFGKKAYENASKILPVSEFLSQMVQKSIPLPDKNKFKVIGNVVDSGIFQYKEKALYEESREMRLCSIATWNSMKNPAKQPELLIDAISLLQQKSDKKIILTFIGSGDKINELKKRCRDKGINAIFTGHLQKADIVAHLHASDLFVHPSSIETFGIVVVEALQTGTPVICSDTGALRELVNAGNGMLCHNNVEEWACMIENFFTASFDHAKIAKDIKGRFDIAVIGKKINAIYRELS